ncbi:MAG: 30S ribosome-binding factor RbfA [Clostridia bacterium]|jgi:ribosome-binding factor A
MNYTRTDRVSEEIKKEVSNIIRDELKDPRIASINSITKVHVTKDLRHAKIYISVLGESEEQKATIDALNHAAGFIRKELGRRIRIRYTPEILFLLDASIAYSVHISKLIDDVTGQKDDGNDV